MEEPSTIKIPINIKKKTRVLIDWPNITKVFPPMLPIKNEKNIRLYIKPFDVPLFSATKN